MECAARGRGEPCAPGPPTRRCGLCGAVAYCSPSHQALHWNEHKEECARLEEHMKHADLLNDFPFTFSMEATRSIMLKNWDFGIMTSISQKIQYVGSRFHSPNTM